MTQYKMIGFEKTNPPAEVKSSSWYKFIISNNQNTITNLRSGTKKEVEAFAIETVNRLNEKYYTHINFKMHRPVNEINLLNSLALIH